MRCSMSHQPLGQFRGYGAGQETVYRSGDLGRTSFRQADLWGHGPNQGFIQKCHTAVSRAHKLPGLVECFPKMSKRVPTTPLWLNEKRVSWKLLEKWKMNLLLSPQLIPFMYYLDRFEYKGNQMIWRGGMCLPVIQVTIKGSGRM